eukprot:5054275-Pleurochrysis_carterae.AAC.3
MQGAHALQWGSLEGLKSILVGDSCRGHRKRTSQDKSASTKHLQRPAKTPHAERESEAIGLQNGMSANTAFTRRGREQQRKYSIGQNSRKHTSRRLTLRPHPPCPPPPRVPHRTPPSARGSGCAGA